MHLNQLSRPICWPVSVTLSSRGHAPGGLAATDPSLLKWAQNLINCLIIWYHWLFVTGDCTLEIYWLCNSDPLSQCCSQSLQLRTAANPAGLPLGSHLQPEMVENHLHNGRCWSLTGNCGQPKRRKMRIRMPAELTYKTSIHLKLSGSESRLFRTQ
jgi:hypothetical protein